MTKIYIIRHAEAEGNLYRCAHGQTDGHITPRGYIQIDALSRRFEDEHIDAVYSSDLTRTMETSKAITKNKSLALTTTPLLREVCMGDWEQMAWGDIFHAFPEKGTLFNLDPENWSVEGSEGYHEIIARMKQFITKAAKEHDGETIALFSHGFAIRALFCDLMGLASKDIIELPYCDNTAVALLTYDSGDFTIEFQGDNTHLSGDESTFAHQHWWKNEKVVTTENFRYPQFDETGDHVIIEAYTSEFGALPKCDIQFSVYLADEAAGFLGLSELDDKTGELTVAYLLPDYRNLGFGIQLFGKAISVMRLEGKQFMQVTAPEDSYLVKICKKHGFEEISKTDGVATLKKFIDISRKI